MKLLGLILLCVINSVFSEKVADEVSIDEWAKAFPIAGTQEVEYEIVPIHTSRLHKRDLKSRSTHIHLKAFGNDVNLWLNPSDGILVGENTPIFLMTKTHKFAKYANVMKSVAQNLYEDAQSKATVFIDNDVDNELPTVTGYVGNNNIYIRGIPRDMWSVINRHGRFIRSIPDEEREQYAYHMVYKVAGLPEVVKYLEAPLTTNATRSRRAVQSIVYPEILVIVDYPLYKKLNLNIWEALSYLLPFWNAVDMKFRGLESPKFRLNIAGFMFAEHEGALPYMKKHKVGKEDVAVNEALHDTRTWMFEVEEVISMDEFDVSVTMTSDHLCQLDSSRVCRRGTLGLAFVAGACQYDKSYKPYVNSKNTIVHDTTAYDGIHTTAHELGHLFGASHDTGAHDQCSHEDGHMMAGSIVFNGRASDWSPCSLKDFETYLRKKNSKCLENKPNPGARIPRYTPGKFVDADEQCKRMYGTSAAREIEANVCKVLWCHDPSDPNGHRYVATSEAAEGTPCAPGKICLQSDCVDEKTGRPHYFKKKE